MHENLPHLADRAAQRGLVASVSAATAFGATGLVVGRLWLRAVFQGY